MRPILIGLPFALGGYFFFTDTTDPARAFATGAATFASAGVPEPCFCQGVRDPFRRRPACGSHAGALLLLSTSTHAHHPPGLHRA